MATARTVVSNADSLSCKATLRVSSSYNCVAPSINKILQESAAYRHLYLGLPEGGVGARCRIVATRRSDRRTRSAADYSCLVAKGLPTLRKCMVLPFGVFRTLLERFQPGARGRTESGRSTTTNCWFCTGRSCKISFAVDSVRSALRSDGNGNTGPCLLGMLGAFADLYRSVEISRSLQKVCKSHQAAAFDFDTTLMPSAKC